LIFAVRGVADARACAAFWDGDHPKFCQDCAQDRHNSFTAFAVLPSEGETF
jgi:hypothetical protein